MSYHKESKRFAKYFWIEERQVAVANDSLRYLVSDPNQSQRMEVDAAGKAGFYADYEPHGSSVMTVGADGAFSRFKYADALSDRELGIIQMKTRFYSPRVEMFLSADRFMLENPDKVIVSPLDGNLNRYAKNDPVNYRDPTGKNPGVLVGGEVGRILGTLVLPDPGIWEVLWLGQ